MSFSDYEEWLKLTSPSHCRENKIAAFRYMAPTHLVSTTLGPQTQAHCTTQLYFSLSFDEYFINSILHSGKALL